MSTEENKALARRFYGEFNKGNVEGMMGCNPVCCVKAIE
jgi:hypothetical protein